MTSIIRSVRFDDKPRVLARATVIRESVDRSNSGDKSETLSSLGAPISVKAASAHAIENVTAPTEPVEPPVTIMSYPEYRIRFHEELDALRTQTLDAARREGHAKGIAAGREEGKAEFSERLQQIDAVLASAREAAEQHLGTLADTAVEIVFESVTKILGAQFADRTGTEVVVREVIRQSKERNKLLVRLSPADHALLADRHAELADGLNVGQVEYVADDLVELGGCVLETPSGSLDGRLEIQLRRFRETLINARMKGHEHGD